jgi:FkbM family methyltransferase
MAVELGGGLKSMVRRGLERISGNAAGQRALRFIARQSMSLMGIGSGGVVAESGEAAAVALLPKLCPPPFRILDVGANAGQFMSMAYTTLREKPVAYHAFEPARATFERLKETAGAIGAQPPPVLNKLALGRSSGTATLYSDAPGSGLASLTHRRLGHFGIDFSQFEIVDVLTVDEYCASVGLEAIDLLKMDVEGHELDVLAGATRLLGRRGIRIVLFEFGGAAIDTKISLQDFFYFFQEHNMCLHRITPSGYLHPMPTYDEFDEQFRTTNFLATLEPTESGPGTVKTSSSPVAR